MLPLVIKTTPLKGAPLADDLVFGQAEQRTIQLRRGIVGFSLFGYVLSIWFVSLTYCTCLTTYAIPLLCPYLDVNLLVCFIYQGHRPGDHRCEQSMSVSFGRCNLHVKAGRWFLLMPTLMLDTVLEHNQAGGFALPIWVRASFIAHTHQQQQVI